MNITLCSAFRNASWYIPRYISQVDTLADALRKRGDKLRCIWAHGDSKDDTGETLRNEVIFRGAALTLRFSVDLFEANHGGPEHGSVVNAQRFRQLAGVWNAIWERIPLDADVVVFCEADLIWETSTMLALIDQLTDVPAIAPMVMLQRQGYPPPFFYDAWGFRKNGKQFNPTPPYFDGWPATERVQVDSAGSLVVMRAGCARQCRWRADDLIVGICRQIVEQGGSIFVDSMLCITHL